MFTTFRGGQTGAWRITALLPVKGDALPPVTAISITSGAAIALPLLPSQTSWRVAGGGCNEPPALCRARREGKTRGSAGRARPRRGHLRGADPNPEIIRLVGTDARGAAEHFRGQVAPHRRHPEIPAGDRAAALS